MIKEIYENIVSKIAYWAVLFTPKKDRGILMKWLEFKIGLIDKDELQASLTYIAEQQKDI